MSKIHSCCKVTENRKDGGILTCTAVMPTVRLGLRLQHRKLGLNPLGVFEVHVLSLNNEHGFTSPLLSVVIYVPNKDGVLMYVLSLCVRVSLFISCCRVL